VHDLSNSRWMTNDRSEGGGVDGVDVEGPILASWLVLIQVHAERGCGGGSPHVAW
jgi:hypothetical protein